MLMARAIVLMVRAVLPLALLTVTAVGIYLAIANPSAALIFVTGLQGAVWILVIGGFFWSPLRGLRSLAQRVRLFGRVLLPLGSTLFLVSTIGQRRGWLHGGAESALTWTGCVFAFGVPVYLIGERRLMAVLTARAAAKQEQPE